MHYFHFEKVYDNTDIGYGIIIGQDMIVELVLIANLNLNTFKWDDAIVPMNKLGFQSLGLLKQKLTKRNILKAAIYTSEPTYTR